MSKLAERTARNLIIMITADCSKISEVLEMAKCFNIKATHIQQLALPKDEIPASRILIEALKRS